jgi:hypothetical protein
VANVNLKEMGEEIGFAVEGGESFGEEERGTVHEEHGAGHEVGEAVELCVGSLVGMEGVGVEEIGGFEGFGESESLAETESEAFARDGVDGARGVADERDVAGGDAVEAAADGDGTRSIVAGDGSTEALLEGGIEGECVGDTG